MVVTWLAARSGAARSRPPPQAESVSANAATLAAAIVRVREGVRVVWICSMAGGIVLEKRGETGAGRAVSRRSRGF